MICSRTTKLARQIGSSMAICLISSACTFADATKPSPLDQATVASVTKMTADNAVEPRFLAAGGGIEYDWGKDHIFVKLTSDETGGALTLIQDNLKPGFNLGMHLHRAHTEIFYILEGDVEFQTPTASFTAQTGSVVYLGAGTPHAANSSTGGRMLMFYAPGGFDRMLAEIENATWFQKINPFERARRDERNDFIKASGKTPISANAPAPVFVTATATPSQTTGVNSAVVKLSLDETKGLAQVAEEHLAPGVTRSPAAAQDWDEILYVPA